MVPPEPCATWRRTIHSARSIISKGSVTVFCLHLLLGSFTAIKTKKYSLHFMAAFSTPMSSFVVRFAALPLGEVQPKRETLQGDAVDGGPRW